MTQYAIVNAESIITEIGDEDARDEMFSRTGHTRELVRLTREHSVGDEIDYTDRGVELYADPVTKTYRVYRFDSASDMSQQTLLADLPSEDAAIEYARLNGGHQVQDSDDGEPVNVTPDPSCDPAEEAACAADRAYDQAKDDALTGDR